jgi:hypothetical protein
MLADIRIQHISLMVLIGSIWTEGCSQTTLQTQERPQHELGSYGVVVVAAASKHGVSPSERIG